MIILITGAGGLIGSEAVEYFCDEGHRVLGVEDNTREEFFGQEGSIMSRLHQISHERNNFKNYFIDITNYDELRKLFSSSKFDVIIHTAAQPSHDLAAKIPLRDFQVNANGTLNLLELTRQYCPEAIFIHMSTNKVYGDKPNTLGMVESKTRFDFNAYDKGISETFSIDQSTHSLFGASKLAADILVQEYGRYFGIKSCILRAGCLTGENHSGVQLHGFLNYLIKCNVNSISYKVFGYKGKQVRDNLHAYDVIKFFDEFIKNPRVGEVYNIGGGYNNSCSILEAFDLIENISGHKMIYEISPESRIGDHKCYYSDLTKIQSHYPDWKVTIDLPHIFKRIYNNILV